MDIRHIHIQNYRAIESLELDLKDATGRVRPVTVLAGPNGSGKTSVLFAVVQALRGPLGYRTEDVPEPGRLDIHREGGQIGLRDRPVEVRVTLQVGLPKDERDAITQVFQEAQETPTLRAPNPTALPALPADCMTLIWTYPPATASDGARLPSWSPRQARPQGAAAWLKGRQVAIRSKLRRLLSDRRLADRIGGLLLFPQDRNLRVRVLGDDVSHAKGIEPDRPSMTEEEGEEAHVRPRSVDQVWGILNYLSNYVHNRENPLSDEDNWEKRIQDLFATICSPKTYVGFRYEEGDPYGAPYLRERNAEYPLQMAASGELVIIEYLTRLTYPNPLNRSLILIDEPEVHLHPQWIRQLYLALPKMGDGNQFLVTTHSPELRALAADDGALIDLGQLGG